MHYPLRLYGILSARVSLGFGLALAASVAAAASPITVDFTAQNFYSLYGSYSPPQAVVTGSFTVSSDLTQLLAFSMDIAGYHYGLSNTAYNPGYLDTFSSGPHTFGSNSFSLTMDPSLLPPGYGGYVPSLSYSSSYNTDPTGWTTGSPVTYSLVSSVPEPADVTLMGLGLGLVGFVVSRRRKV